MTTIHVLLEIKVDEDNIAEKYSNFSTEYPDVNTFIEVLTNDLETSSEEGQGHLIDHLDKYGYSIKVITEQDRIDTLLEQQKTLGKEIDGLNKAVKEIKKELEVDEDCDANKLDSY